MFCGEAGGLIVVIRMDGASGTSRKRWCVLRTNGQRTVPLMISLRSAGFEAWTPVERVSRRKSRSKAVIEFDVPMMPSWVFADASHIVDLINAAGAPIRQHPAFSLFRHCDRFPVIADRELTKLRQLEDEAVLRALRRSAKETRQRFNIGDEVRIIDAQSAWRGLSGVVESSDNKDAMIYFGGTQSVKIDTCLLLSVGANGEQIAALAA